MHWNKRAKAERPEYPKMVAINATPEEAEALLPILKESDPEAALVTAGERGLYIRVHNEAAEVAAKRFSESRSFPLASKKDH